MAKKSSHEGEEPVSWVTVKGKHFPKWKDGSIGWQEGQEDTNIGERLRKRGKVVGYDDAISYLTNTKGAYFEKYKNLAGILTYSYSMGSSFDESWEHPIYVNAKSSEKVIRWLKENGWTETQQNRNSTIYKRKGRRK